MSEVICFRLDRDNPREAQALQVLAAWQEAGFSRRHVLTEALLRLDGDIRTVIDQLEGIGSSLSVPTKGGRIKSLGDGLARALGKYVAAKERDGLDAILSGHVKSLDPPETSNGSANKANQEALFKIKCPDCDSAGTLAFEEGCLKCHACGYCMC